MKETKLSKCLKLAKINKTIKIMEQTAPSVNISHTIMKYSAMNGEINPYKIPDNVASITLDGKIYLISKEIFEKYHQKYSKSMGDALKKYVKEHGVQPIKLF